MMDDEQHRINEYIEEHSTKPDAVLQSLYRYTNLHVMNPRMMSGQVQGKFLEFVCRMLKPRHVLEIGTFTGYSAISMASGLPDGSTLTTIEANEEYEAIIRKHLHEARLDDKVTLIIGDAKQIIPTLDMAFDLVFIDADKISYPAYYGLVFDKVAKDGYILADNVLWENKVLDAHTKQHDTQAIKAFNDMVMQDDRVENVLLPIRDGLMMIRKK